ncbi:tape measure protein [Bifidobacterium sp. ESL0690]|uniref:tape measure protein n=1 Tax=Bifidobacterium sp. ESL0690 TaxID=2983214 RepID=UPI0023F75907|nr:tape measure protein [Bifidobacterium sp. ESL0690]WEV47010.1 tape measure protein [Bifidobacterium sp. ESL0690]
MSKTAILAVRIIGDSSGASKAMSSAGGSASALAAKFGAVSGLVSGAVSSMTSHVIGYVSNLSGEMASTSDSAQSFANTLKFAGVDDSKIQALTKSTQKYADQTVFSLSDIRNTTAQLASNGVQGYSELAEAAGNLTAVAGGGADAYKSVAMVLTQTAGAGKLTTENWNQLSDAIPGASGKLQEAMKANGAYTGNFRDAMAAGQITSDEFNQALMQLGMSDAAKKAANDTTQLGNASGNLEASVVKLGAGMLDLVKPEVTGFMSGMADWVSNLADGLPGLSGRVQGLAGDLEGKLGSAINWVKTQGGQAFQMLKDSAGPVLDGLKSGVQGVKDVAEPFVGTVRSIGSAIAGSLPDVSPWSSLRDALTGVGGAMEAVGGFASAHASGIQTVAVMAGAAAAAYGLWNGAIAAYNGVMAAKNAVTGIATGVQAAFNVVMDANPIMLVVMAVAAVTAGLVYFFTQTQTGQQQWAAFTGFLGSSINNVKSAFGQAADWASGKWHGLIGWFESVPGTIAGFFSGIGETLVRPFRDAVAGIKSAWNSVVGGKGFDIPDWVPGVGGKSFRIPMLAQGGVIRSAGSVLVGEAGPEVLSLPMGARVTPLALAQRTPFNGPSAGGSQTVPIIINLTVNGILDGEDGARKIIKVIKDYQELRR